MKKSFLKGASLFLASVLTIGMCSGYRVEAKTKFSVPKKVTLSYDKEVNGVYTNVIWINGTTNAQTYQIQDNFKGFKSSNKKVIRSKYFGRDFYPICDGLHPGAKTISITPNKNCKVKSAYIHKTYNGTPQKVKTPSSFNLKEGYDGFVIMENKKNKLTETVAFTYWNPAPLDDEDF